MIHQIYFLKVINNKKYKFDDLKTSPKTVFNSFWVFHTKVSQSLLRKEIRTILLRTLENIKTALETDSNYDFLISIIQISRQQYKTHN